MYWVAEILGNVLSMASRLQLPGMTPALVNHGLDPLTTSRVYIRSSPAAVALATRHHTAFDRTSVLKKVNPKP